MDTSRHNPPLSNRPRRCRRPRPRLPPAPSSRQAPAPWRRCKPRRRQDQAAYERLLGNSGITLQWLWSASRGQLNAKDENGVVRLEGTQSISKAR